MDEFNPSSAGFLRIHALLTGRTGSTEEGAPGVEFEESPDPPVDTPNRPGPGTPWPDAAPREARESDVYIDRGPALPEACAVGRFRVLVRDPETLFVYWDLPDDRVPASGGRAPIHDGWDLVIIDPEGRVLQSFQTPPASRCGYVQVPAATRCRVLIRAILNGSIGAPLAELELGTPSESPSERREVAWAELVLPANEQDPRTLRLKGEMLASTRGPTYRAEVPVPHTSPLHALPRLPSSATLPRRNEP
jgi:hypothetical protein